MGLQPIRFSDLTAVLGAAVATAIAGLLDLFTLHRVPAGAGVAVLTVGWAAFRSLRGRELAGWATALAYVPVAVLVGLFAGEGIADESVNTPDVLSLFVFAIEVGLAVLLGAVLVLPTSLLASLLLGKRPPARQGFVAISATAVSVAAALVLIAVGAMTAARRPTQATYVAKLPVAQRLAPVQASPESRGLPWASVLSQTDMTCGRLQLRRIQFSESCSVVASLDLAKEPPARFLPDVRGEPGDYGPVFDFCGPATLRCDPAQGLAVLDVDDVHAIYTESYTSRSESLPSAVSATCAPSHVWLGLAVTGVLFAVGCILWGRRTWADPTRGYGSAQLALATLASLLCSTPLAVALHLGRIGWR